jgi:methylenetetrahydrofolate reductase (NADPH)
VQLIRDIYRTGAEGKRPILSFEFFAPKTEEGDRNLLSRTVPALIELRPDYCSVTYGAGGSTRNKTLTIVDRIQREHRLTAMAHLTCVAHTRAEVAAVLAEAQRLGIHNILALRGDPPGGEGPFQPVEGGFEFSYQLVQLIRQAGGFCIGAAGFPEGHIECKEGKLVDWDRLKFKIDQGVDFILTQLFFDNADYLSFRDHLTHKLGVTIPLVPGVLPILSSSQIKKFTTLCGAHMPVPMLERLDQLGDDDKAVTEYGIDYAAQQCADLIREGVPGIHFYTLNKAYSTTRIVRSLGLA